MTTSDPVASALTRLSAWFDHNGLAGWDPYEVWYTRVYLPRLESERLPPKRTPLDASTELRTLEVEALLAGPSTR